MKKNKNKLVPVDDIHQAISDLEEQIAGLEDVKKKLADLIADLCTGKFVTKSESELISRLQSIYLQL